MISFKTILNARNILPKLRGLEILKQGNLQRFYSDQTPQQTPTFDKLYKKIEIELRGNDREVMNSYGKFATTAADHLGITVGRNTEPRKAIHERYTVLRSAFVHKKHRTQYETRTYFRYIDFFRLTGSTADTFLEYIQRNLPEGVAMKVTKVEIRKLPEMFTKAPAQNTSKQV